MKLEIELTQDEAEYYYLTTVAASCVMPISDRIAPIMRKVQEALFIQMCEYLGERRTQEMTQFIVDSAKAKQVTIHISDAN